MNHVKWWKTTWSNSMCIYESLYGNANRLFKVTGGARYRGVWKKEVNVAIKDDFREIDNSLPKLRGFSLECCEKNISCYACTHAWYDIILYGIFDLFYCGMQKNPTKKKSKSRVKKEKDAKAWHVWWKRKRRRKKEERKTWLSNVKSR